MSRSAAQLAFLLANCAGLAQPQAPSAPNPHWQPDGCAHCHTAGEPIRAIGPEQIDSLCLRCHDGRQATRELHPIGRGFPTRGYTRPEAWPAPGGLLSCSTCHEIVAGCHVDRRRPARNSVFLRDYDEGNPAAFCAKCHLESDASARYNPHLLIPGLGMEAQTGCRFCHQSEIASSIAAIRTGRSRLKTPEPVLCLSCHDRHLDYFEPGHTGARVAAPMKAYMEATEPSKPGSGEPPATWPLGTGDTVVCSTCHNPHPAGVFPGGSVMAKGAIKADGPSNLGLREDREGFCLGCHRP